jgi:O-acetyl-ADP-ribose deacetylase (regulator of RNase III)
VWGEGGEGKKLQAAILGSLSLADELDLSSVAMPAISTGIFGFPKEQAAGIILRAIQAYFDQTPESHLELVRLTLFDTMTVDAFLSAWKELGLENEA